MTYFVFVESGSTDVFDAQMLEEQYREILDESGPVVIGTLEYDASHVLETVDPIAYRVGFSDFTSDYEEHAIPDKIEWDDIPEYLGLV